MSPRSVPLLATLAILIVGLRAISSSPQADQMLQVIDGDTLQVDGAIVQLYGIDAPELGQLCESDGSLRHCGVDAALALRKLIDLSRGEFHCSPWQGEGAASDPTTYVCEVRDEDVAEVLLDNGYGLTLPGSFPDYVEAQQRAQRAELGIWHSDFVPPWIWRQGVGSATRPSDARRDCNVKGVTGSGGQRLYFVPTDPGYNEITIDPAAGDTLFCSDEEARRAGWGRGGGTAGGGSS
jgi:endonuclease YncB( thermonuclease family)